MKTCLSIIWDELIEIYYNFSNDSDDCLRYKKEMNDLIDCIYENFQDQKPLHLVEFQKGLLNDKLNFVEVAIRALSVVNCCELCAVCVECAKKFYEVIKGEKKERPLPGELRNYFADNSQVYYYLSAYSNVKSYRNIKNSLVCLKGFSSTTPTIYSAAFSGNVCVGGGLYLNVNDFGIAIDPGISFVENMHRQGIFITDINAVIVTHNHLDHNKDLGTISALQHDLNRYCQSQVKFYKKYFDCANLQRHEISWWLDESTKKINESIVPCSTDLAECVEWTQINDDISFVVIKTEHIKDGKSYGIKLKVKINDKIIIIGYTSDTKCFRELIKFMEESDIIVFNISDIYENDVRGIKQKNGHLGYDGSIRLLKEERQKYQLAIASEFCCSNGDYRMRVVRKLQEQTVSKKHKHIIPGEVGLKVDLDTTNIYCSRCKRALPMGMMTVVAPKMDFGEIEYICNNCQQ